MNPGRFLQGGKQLGLAEIMHQRKLNGASAMSNAARQFNVSGSPHGQQAGAKAQQIAGDFARLGGNIHAALSLAQAAGGAGYQAVSCGWWLGHAYGCCQHKLKDIQTSTLAGFAINASEHAIALSRTGHSRWSEGDIDHQFGVIAEALAGLKLADYPLYATKIDTLVAQFESTLY